MSPLAVGLGVGLGALFCCCALACILLLARQHQRAKGQREMAGVGANYVPADGPERAPQTVPEVELAARYDEVPPPFEVVRAAVGLQPPIALERIPAVSRPAGYFAVPAAASSDVAIAASTALRQRAPSRWAILTPRLQSGTLVRSRTGSTNSAAGRCHPSSFSPLAMQPGPEPPQGLPAPRGRSNAIVAPPVMTRLRTASVAIFTPVVAFVTRLRGWTVTTRTTTTPPSAPPEVGGAPDAMRPAHGALAIVELDNDPALPPGQLPEPPTAAPPAPLSVVEAHRDGRSRFIALPSNAAAPHPAAAANTVVAASPVITGRGHAVPPSGGAGPLMMRSPPRAATSGIIADVPAIELLDSGNAQLSAVPGTIGALLDHSNHRSVPRLLLPISLPSQARPGQPARLALPSQSSRPLPATSAAVARPLAGTAAPSAVTQQLLLSHAPAGRMRSSSTALSLLLADYGGPAPPAVRGSVRDGESGFGAASERLVTPGAFIRRSGNHRRRVGGQSHSPPPQAAASAPRAPSMRPVLAAAAGACRWQPADETSSRSAGEVATKAPSSASRHATPTTPAASFEQQRAEIPLQADGDFSVDDASELVEVIAALEAAFDRRSRGVFESAAATDASPVAPSAARSAQATIHAPPRRLHSTVAVSSRRDDAELDEQADPVMVSPSPASLVVRPPTSNFAAASASAPSPALPVTADATATVASDPLAGPLHACLPSLPASQSVTVRGGSSPPLPALPLPPVLRDDDNWGAALDWVLAEGAVPSLLPEPDALGARSPPGGVALHCGQARVAEFAETQRAPRQPTAVISASAASDVLETGSVALGNSQIAPMPVIEEGSSPAHAVARAGPSAVAGTTAATAARGITTATEVEDDLLESLFFTPSRNSL